MVRCRQKILPPRSSCVWRYDVPRSARRETGGAFPIATIDAWLTKGACCPAAGRLAAQKLPGAAIRVERVRRDDAVDVGLAPRAATPEDTVEDQPRLLVSCRKPRGSPPRVPARRASIIGQRRAHTHVVTAPNFSKCARKSSSTPSSRGTPATYPAQASG